MHEVIFDMETHDPDDYLTLLLLLGHPQVRLKAVTITPGSAYQVGLVRRTLELFQVDIPVGAYNIDHPKTCVSSWHEKAYGKIEPSRDAEIGGEILRRYCDENTTLITGGPLKNLGVALDFSDFRLGRLTAQGGFAGEGVVPPEKQLEKFKGMRTCPTFNLNGDPGSALRALADVRIGKRYFVSKNVCHGVYYDDVMHAWVARFVEGSRSMGMIHQGMEVFLNKKRDKIPVVIPVNEAIKAERVNVIDGAGNRVGIQELSRALAMARESNLDLVEVQAEQSPPLCRIMKATPAETVDLREAVGKKLHDPLAACCAIEPAIAQWAEVEMYREKGNWGARLQAGSNTWIITDYNHQEFLNTFTARRNSSD